MFTAVCIANGTSLTKEDVEFCKGKGKIYAVKEAALLAPFADVLYAADVDWWKLPTNKLAKEFQGEKWTVADDSNPEIKQAVKDFGLKTIKYMSSAVWSSDPSYIATGHNSGFQAINLAVLHGASRVILLGYDMGYSGQNKHWWTGQVKRDSRWSDYQKWIRHFNQAAPLIPVPVINATRGGNLECFARMPINEAFVFGAA